MLHRQPFTVATGGNGVILVTTKMGTPGKLLVNLNLYHGVEQALNKLELMNSQEYMAVCEETSTAARALNEPSGYAKDL